MRIDLCAFADEAADDLEGQIAALKRNGIKKLELRSVGGVNVKDLSIDTAKEIAEELAAADVAVWSIGSPIGKSDIGGDFKEVKAQLEHVLELCGIFGCDKIRMFSFFLSEYGKYRDEVISRLRSLTALAAERGVTLFHENEKNIYGDTAERVRDVLDSVDGLESVYDPANFIQVGESIENMAPMRKRAGYFHIKDALASGELVPAGEGVGDIRRLISEIDRDVTLTVEPHLAVFSGYAAIDSHKLKNKYEFPSRDAAFDAAVNALKNLLKECGYVERDGYFTK